MSVGTVDETEDNGGLDGLLSDDEQAENAGPGETQLAAPGADAGGIPLVGEPAAQPGAGDSVPGSGGASTQGFPGVPVFEPLGNAPPPPELTDDPAENNRRLVSWQRALTAHQGEVQKRQTAFGEFAAKVGAARGAQEAQIATAKEEAVKAANAQAAERRARAQAAVDAAVKDRLEAKQSLESFKWERPKDGASIAAMIVGALGAGLSNAAAAQIGAVGHAENEGIKAIDARMKRDYEAKKAKYAAAGDALLMAKYGVKDAETAHRAQLNDLDADFSARWKRVAAEADAVLKQQGVPEAQVKGNALYATALQEAAKHEEQIHDREESHQIAREHNHAMEAIARENMRNTRADRRERQDDKAQKRDEETSVYNPRTGEKTGNAPTKERAGSAQADLNQLANIRNDLGALKGHVQSEGAVANLPLLGPMSDAARTRESLAKSVVTGLAAYKKLGAISADDRKIIEGMTGGGLAGVMGLNANQIDTLTAAIDRAEESALKSQGIGGRRAPAPGGGDKKRGFDAPGGARYELGADGNYHKVK